MGKACKKQSSLFVKLLRRRVHETYGSFSNPSINELVDVLRTKYPEYTRHKPQLLTRMVKQTLDSHNNNNKRKLSRNNDEDDDDITSVSSCKKAKKIDIREESSEDGDEDMSAAATSYSPEFDLTKSMLRNKYKPKTVELELLTDSIDRKVDLRMEDKSVKPANNFPNADGVGKVRLKDLGGIDDVLRELLLEVIIPWYRPDVPLSIGVRPTTGILLHGPPGCGKTTLANAIANEAGVPFYNIAAPELVYGVSGESEEKIRELFSNAHKTAPSIVFIDEIDTIASKRENLQREMDKRIVTQLMICMDSASKCEDGKPGYVLVIGATNRPDALDQALRRPGRFDCEITLGVPDEKARTKILRVLTRNVKLGGAFDPVKISKLTPGFAGTDLESLVNQAGILSINRSIVARELEFSSQDEYWWKKTWTSEEKANLSITREGFTSIPDVKWEDIGGLDRLRMKFNEYIVNRIKDPVAYEKPGLNNLETAFLLHGPPGCGKTLIAKAVANEAGANFIHIKGPEIMNKYVGESELAVRNIFSRARTCSPCIIFFDEVRFSSSFCSSIDFDKCRYIYIFIIIFQVDALTSQRGKEGGWVVDRVLLSELDGGDPRKGVYVIGATNRLDVIDRALLRSGRFGEILYVTLPNQDERGLILKTLSKNCSLDADVDLIAIARSKACENLSGADLKRMMAKAAMVAHRENCSKIKAVHFEKVLKKIKPSVTDKV
ncbi:putative AAA+ ATPase domain, ATPase, AAA-type, core, AAA ATPase, AAA+ lid domain-containing protein [Helianthus annuus]|nr:putative AAA+ ATPase domain, ATPase, AAA-type, core, AAA ATPase, AAA+ lid domain-containing protein [Helianthus annuus]KAJ0687756.1 putative AAA+ ATPase domain, ATPase, AAA-type, core, AAA ATPase, AAA+ lid domain-containing protein [Helianthus annuus]KAJ0873326.1 putative AAA+ ATPase domain, ATPase, AAA-type, core, AAA ATPase, AAA+ lid domain-containing protein [Helianthus annuus]KAJ0873328.1 putative AAA+ ATPase domain, ATPase, AAA-type, core, AAA ATPase, AAA+ lid domain-containing protein [